MDTSDPSDVPHKEHLTFVDLVQGQMRPVEDRRNWYTDRAAQRKSEYDLEQQRAAQQPVAGS